MEKLMEGLIERKRSVLLFFAMIFIVGYNVLLMISKESNPDITLPYVYVSVHYTGISPQDSERLILKPLEIHLKSLEGLKEMTGRAYEGGGNVLLEFESGYDIDKAIDETKDQVDFAKIDMPEEADEPFVREVNMSSFPILVMGLYGNLSDRVLLKAAQKLQDRLESISEVLEVNIGGEREEKIEIIVDPLILEGYSISPLNIANQMKSNNVLLAVGSLEQERGRFGIKLPGLIDNVVDLLTLPVVVKGDVVISLSDVAQIRSTHEDPRSFARINGKPGLTISIVKRSGTNVVDTVDKVIAAIEESRQYFPEGLELVYLSDESKEVRSDILDLGNSVILAVLMVIVVVMASLGVRSGILVGLTIPGSFLMGILILYMAGITMNTIVFFGLILATGMLVDGAIVVTEYADRQMGRGKSTYDAYLEAARFMFWPITSSTLTTLAVFIPLLFWEGIVGEFMKYLPYTMLAILLSSLLMALVFLPIMGTFIGKPNKLSPVGRRQLEYAEYGDLSKLTGGVGLYYKSLEKVLKAPVAVFLGSFVLFAAVVVLYAMVGKKAIFFPSIEASQIQVLVGSRGSLSIYEKQNIVIEVEKAVFKAPGIRSVYSVIGAGAGSDSKEDVIGKIGVEFVDWNERPKSEEIMDIIQKNVSHIAGITISIEQNQDGPPVGKPVELRVLGQNLQEVIGAVDILLGKISTFEGVYNVEDTRPLPGVDWEYKVDRKQAAKFGLDYFQIGEFMRMVTNGAQIGSYRPDTSEEEVDILVRFPEKLRSLDQLSNIRIVTDKGSVPIGSLLTRFPTQKIDVIHRTEGVRYIDIMADVREGVIPAVLNDELRQWLPDSGIDLSKVFIQPRGESEEMQKSSAFLGKAFLLAVGLMALILLIQFNSFYQTWLILLSVVLAVTGVLLGLLILDRSLVVVMTGIGLIALAGIVVNNNIVLIDTFNNLKTQYSDPVERVIRTGVQRVRPVFLTTVTTCLGLLPMALGMNTNFIDQEITLGAPTTQWWMDLSTAIVSGLIFATFLTLFVTPCALILPSYCKNKYMGTLKRLLKKFKRGTAHE